MEEQYYLMALNYVLGAQRRPEQWQLVPWIGAIGSSVSTSQASRSLPV